MYWDLHALVCYVCAAGMARRELPDAMLNALLRTVGDAMQWCTTAPAAALAAFKSNHANTCAAVSTTCAAGAPSAWLLPSVAPVAGVGAAAVAAAA